MGILGIGAAVGVGIGIDKIKDARGTEIGDTLVNRFGYLDSRNPVWGKRDTDGIFKKSLTIIPKAVDAIVEILGEGTRLFMQNEMYMWYNMPDRFVGKSVANGCHFLVTMLPNKTLIKRIRDGKCSIPPIIRSWHINEISIPSLNFSKQTIMYGNVPRGFSVIDDNPINTNVEITFEEDNVGSIEYFKNWLQKTIIDSEGLHVPPNLQKLFNIVVTQFDASGYPTGIYTLKNCYYVQSMGTNLSYVNNSIITRKISFGTEQIAHFNPTYFASEFIQSKLF